MNETKVSGPSVYDYTDYREFLKALYEFEKGKGDFSYSLFAERAGFKSRSLLRMVIAGKRGLSADAISKVIVGFGLGFAEGETFKALVNFNQASDFKTRKYYWETFLKLRPKTKQNQRVNDEYLYLARMAYPILLTVLRQPHVKKDVISLSQMIGLKPVEIEEGIKTLIQLGAVKELHSGEYILTADCFRTSNDTPSIARQSFHTNMLEKAKEALNLDHSLREFQNMMLPLNREEFLYLRQRIRALIDETVDKFGGKRPNSEKVYALNINLIPVTPEFIRVDEKSDARQKLGEEVVEEPLEVVS